MSTPTLDESRRPEPNVPAPPVYLRRKAAAEYLRSRYGVGSVVWLAIGATNGSGPLFRKFGNCVFYDTAELDRWIQEKFSAPRRSTSEDPSGHARSPGRPKKNAAPKADPADWQPGASSSHGEA
jgi:hypothetical protein